MTKDLKLPERLSKDAMKAYGKEDYGSAAQAFESARKAYLDAGEDVLAAEMANNLSVTYIQMDRANDALSIVEGTPQIFLTHGNQQLAGRAYGNLAAALEASGQRQEALEYYQLAAQIFSEEEDKEGYALTMQAISRLQLRLGQPIEAVSTMQVGLEAMPKSSLRDRLLKKLIDIPTRLMGS